jgi:hypothetical protein
MGALIVGDVELAVNVEDRQREARRLDPQHIAGRDLVDAAEVDTIGHEQNSSLL